MAPLSIFQLRSAGLVDGGVADGVPRPPPAGDVQPVKSLPSKRFFQAPWANSGAEEAANATAAVKARSVIVVDALRRVRIDFMSNTSNRCEGLTGRRAPWPASDKDGATALSLASD